MAIFEIRRRSGLPAQQSWARITDWSRHSDGLPLTTVHLAGGGPSRPGARVVAHTGLGPLGFDDPMEIVRWNPPTADRDGSCRLVKRGRVVRGWAELEARPASPGSLVVWREEVRLVCVPRAADPLLRPVSRLLFARALDRLLA